ncbi:SDR family oxidoreductase [Nonomuraea sp. NPDC050663]|uniref:SDR family oxidoreductase n=1 Tax=Nonomuraea sp. NPDC050663 TaxID=3364370 RepID=UPI0037A8478E
MRVLLTGATGTMGRVVTPHLVSSGFEVRALSREPRTDPAVDWRRADLATGRGVREAFDGVEAVVHMATLAHRGRRTATVDVYGTRGLLECARSAGVGHVVFPSIVGVGKAPVGYFAHKLRAERIVTDSGLGWTILRATPFHQWLDGLLARAPFLPVDRTVPWQPVDARDVAAFLVDLLTGGPRKTIENFAGPEVLATDELARQ